MRVAIPFPGFYETNLDQALDDDLSNWAEQLAEQHGCDEVTLYNALYDKADWHDARMSVAQAWAGHLQHMLHEINPAIQFSFADMISPREYNFSTDVIEVDISLDVLMVMHRDIDDRVWRETVREECTDRSGFFSFYSGDADHRDWNPSLMCDWDTAQRDLVVKAYVANHLEEDWMDTIEDRMSSNGEFQVSLRSGANAEDIARELAA